MIFKVESVLTSGLLHILLYTTKIITDPVPIMLKIKNILFFEKLLSQNKKTMA